MTKNTLMKFIDSCVGNIARKIEDEFNESDHPRDKGGKFTSKGNEGRGGSTKAPKGSTQAERRMMGKQKESGTTKSSVKPSKALQDDIQDNLRQIAEQSESRDEFMEQAKSYVEDYVADDFAGNDERAQDNYGMSSEDVAKYVEDFVKNQLEKEADDWGFEKDDDTSVTGPEDRDYMNEEDDDDVSLEQYKKNVSENFDGDEEYEVEARYDRAKYHSDKFKKLQNGEYDGTPEEKRLKNYYRRLGIKKPEDAFKVWWDI